MNQVIIECITPTQMKERKKNDRFRLENPFLA